MMLISMGTLPVVMLEEARKCKNTFSTLQKHLLTEPRASEIEEAYSKCPNTKLVASGYSQGGQIVHNAAALLPANVGSWISSVVLFGDPGTFHL